MANRASGWRRRDLHEPGSSYVFPSSASYRADLAKQVRAQAVEQARLRLEHRPVFLDTETTGLATNHQVIEICILDHDGGILVDTLVKPRGRIPADVTRIHGITDEMVRDAPSWPEVWPEVQAALAERHIGVYNAAFDLRLMQQSHTVHGLSWEMAEDNWFCIMLLYAQFFGQWDAYRQSYRWHSLEAARQHFDLALPNAHRARADALLARAVMHHIAGAAL